MKFNKLFALSILALSSILLLTWCNNKIVTQWDTITVSYDSFLQDGKIIANWEEVTFTVWLWQTFPIFDTTVVDMKKWEVKSFTANTEEWYWIYYDTTKVQDITTTVFNKIWTEPKVWETVELGDMKGLVLKVWPLTDKIDFNEPQTREPVEFKIKIVDIAEIK